LNKLENLPEVTEQALNGLRADDSLKNRILNAALREEKPSSFSLKSVRLVPVLLSSVALMLLCVFLLNGKKPLLPEGEKNLIRSFSAGSGEVVSVSFGSFAGTDPASVESVELLSSGKVSDRALVAQLLDALKNHSEIVPNDEIVLNDRLNLFDRDGLLFSLPAEAPYVRWADGVRRCESFFEMFGNHPD